MPARAVTSAVADFSTLASVLCAAMILLRFASVMTLRRLICGLCLAVHGVVAAFVDATSCVQVLLFCVLVVAVSVVVAVGVPSAAGCVDP